MDFTSFGAESLTSSSSFTNRKIMKYRIIISPVYVYGCQNWSLIFMEENRLKMFESGVLREVFYPRRDEVTEEL
jgi:hypothetical protein